MNFPELVEEGIFTSLQTYKEEDLYHFYVTQIQRLWTGLCPIVVSYRQGYFPCISTDRVIFLVSLQTGLFPLRVPDNVMSLWCPQHTGLVPFVVPYRQGYFPWLSTTDRFMSLCCP